MAGLIGSRLHNIYGLDLLIFSPVFRHVPAIGVRVSMLDNGLRLVDNRVANIADTTSFIGSAVVTDVRITNRGTGEG